MEPPEREMVESTTKEELISDVDRGKNYEEVGQEILMPCTETTKRIFSRDAKWNGLDPFPLGRSSIKLRLIMQTQILCLVYTAYMQSTKITIQLLSMTRMETQIHTYKETNNFSLIQEEMWYIFVIAWNNWKMTLK